MRPDEDDPQVVKRLMEEVYQTARVWGWIAAAIAVGVTVTGLILRWLGRPEAMALCLFLAVMMGIVAAGNLVFARKFGREFGAAGEKPEQEESHEQAAAD